MLLLSPIVEVISALGQVHALDGSIKIQMAMSSAF